MRIDSYLRVDGWDAWRRWTRCAPKCHSRTTSDPWSVPYWQHQERENERSGGIHATGGGRCEPCFKATDAPVGRKMADGPGRSAESHRGAGYGLPKLGEIPVPQSPQNVPRVRDEVMRRELGPVGRLIDVMA